MEYVTLEKGCFKMESALVLSEDREQVSKAVNFQLSRNRTLHDSS